MTNKQNRSKPHTDTTEEQEVLSKMPPGEKGVPAQPDVEPELDADEIAGSPEVVRVPGPGPKPNDAGLATREHLEQHRLGDRARRS